MQHDEESPVPKVIDGQMAIPVPDAPGAIGRWTTDDQFAAYARVHGMEKAIEQKKLVDEANACSCGEQARADSLARMEERAPKKIAGTAHKSGCPQHRSFSSAPVRISPAEQEARMNADKPRDAVGRARDEGRI